MKTDPHWPFADPKNVAVLTVPAVMRREAPITHVYHHNQDAAWEFHSLGHEVEEMDVKVVSLAEIVARDPSVKELSLLPCGWEASRPSKADQWIRRPTVT